MEEYNRIEYGYLCQLIICLSTHEGLEGYPVLTISLQAVSGLSITNLR